MINYSYVSATEQLGQAAKIMKRRIEILNLDYVNQFCIEAGTSTLRKTIDTIKLR